jgi:hypothetical protein
VVFVESRPHIVVKVAQNDAVTLSVQLSQIGRMRIDSLRIGHRMLVLETRMLGSSGWMSK